MDHFGPVDYWVKMTEKRLEGDDKREMLKVHWIPSTLNMGTDTKIKCQLIIDIIKSKGPRALGIYSWYSEYP